MRAAICSSRIVSSSPAHIFIPVRPRWQSALQRTLSISWTQSILEESSETICQRSRRVKLRLASHRGETNRSRACSLRTMSAGQRVNLLRVLFFFFLFIFPLSLPRNYFLVSPLTLLHRCLLLLPLLGLLPRLLPRRRPFPPSSSSSSSSFTLTTRPGCSLARRSSVIVSRLRKGKRGQRKKEGDAYSIR